MAPSAVPPTAEVATRLPPLLNLPLKLMLQVVQMLTVPELRILSRVNRGLRIFIANHLSNTCYKSALFRLPKEVLKKIVTQLSSDLGRSAREPISTCFARTSHRFYPALMKHAVVLAIESGSNHFLFQAVKYNDTKLALQTLRLGGNIHSKDCYQSEAHHWCTPLTLAACSGHGAMVRILLDAGAGQGKGNARYALTGALSRGYEGIALLLWEKLIFHDPETSFWYDPYWFAYCSRSVENQFLFLACEAGSTDLSRTILQHHNTFQWRNRRVEIRTCILLKILYRTARRNNSSADRSLPHNVHSITKLLLEYGADPDMAFNTNRPSNPMRRGPWGSIPSGTIREWASKSLDPRVLEVLLGIESTRMEKPDGTSILIGGLSREPREDKAWDIIDAYREEATDPDHLMLDINKSRNVGAVLTKPENRNKIKSRRQAARSGAAHHQGQACERRNRHYH